jgi:hypothetical protein
MIRPSNTAKVATTRAIADQNAALRAVSAASQELGSPSAVLRAAARWHAAERDEAPAEALTGSQRARGCGLRRAPQDSGHTQQ